MTPFMLNYGQNPLTPALLRIPGVENTPAMDMTDALQERMAKAKACMEAAQQRQKLYADQGRRPETFEEGQDVLLSTSNINFKGPGAPKLMPKWIGPYKIVREIPASHGTAYELELLANLRLHDTFHVSLLKPYRADGRVQPPPPELTVDGQIEYEVQCILAHRERRRGRSTKREFLIQWRGYDQSYNTWEPESNLANCQQKLRQYFEAQSST